MLFFVSILLDCCAIALFWISGVTMYKAADEDDASLVIGAILEFALAISLFVGSQIVFYYSLR
jgi:hypothetical protein